MMKLVVSLDELDSFDSGNSNIKTFLENQFPEWNIEYAMSINKAEWDYDNNEVSIPLHVV